MKNPRTLSKRPLQILAVLGLGMCSMTALAQTGVSEDRVSLPEGPGSLEGVGENVGINTNMGSMTHSVKIEVPKGFGGVTPSLDLSYSSGSGESMLGVGWSMSMPSIERMTFKRLPLYQSDDDFCADGSDQLIRLPGTEPAIYRSRYEKGFVRYTWLEEGDGAEGYWLAEYPDGSKGFFGADSEGNLVDSARVSGAEGTFKYLLVEKVDVYGHKMVWSYQKFGNYALPSHIGYVFVDGEPTYEVEFAYEERSDQNDVAFISDAAPGFNLLLTQRIDHIDVKSRGNRIRAYELSYEPYADSGGFTRLTRVETLGSLGGTYPIVFDFEYSSALGGDRPFMMDMGGIGVNLSTGRANLIDINGDALPDIIDASQSGPHKFFINIANQDGTAAFDTTPRSSAVGTQASHPLGAATIQVLDVNGDGFTDLVNAGTGSVLINKGLGDWDARSSEVESGNLADALNEDFQADEGGLQSLRFIDFNNDKLIDVMRATRTQTAFFENQGPDGFEVVDAVTAIEAGFEEDNLQLADMNGDGNLDVVKVQLGSISFRLNFGWGKWDDWVDIEGLPIGDGQIEIAEMEDINGDGMADLVVVQGESVTFALNNNSTSFDDPISLESEDVDGNIPLRDPSVTVLYADMNANGSSDIVWITAQGNVSALDLFPVRPNLMTRITNAIGSITDITYGTAAVEMARDGGVGAWRYKLPSPMNIVTRIDKFDLLTDLHEITEYTYHDGFYDGDEKQFRGFERVESRLIGDDTIEEGFTREVYDVGATDTYRNGLLLSSMVASDGRELNETISTYGDCDVDELAEGLRFPVRHICQRATETITKEGLDEGEWIRTLSEADYDGYGNVILQSEHGITSSGGGACAPCGERGPDEFGVPCGPQCTGDEMFTETDYVSTDNTSGRWITGAPFRVRTFGRAGSALVTESLTYYDGPDFVGLPLGQLDQGRSTRTTRKIAPDSDEVINQTRHKFDAHGNVIESLDPLGEPGGNTHRRTFVMDAENLRVAQSEILLEDPEGNPYRMRRELLYEPLFDKVFEATDWLRVVDGRVVSVIRGFSYEYDEFGRMTARFLPGNSSNDPDEAFEYDLQSPASRIITRKRTEPGQAFDIEVIQCFDGRGRDFQKKTRLEEGVYQASGFKRFNIRSSPVEIHQPYHSDTDACDTQAPDDVLSITKRYDASYREIETTFADAGIYGTASVSRTTFEPFATLSFDAEDNDDSSPHADTPTITRTDGMGRVVSVERLLTPGQPVVTQVHYDSLGHLIGYTDPGDNRKHQFFDLLGRVTRIVDPNSANDTTYEYDHASNIVRKTDDRGITTVTEYEGANRKLAVYDEADEQGTRIEWRYDFDPDCERCTHTEGKTATVTYPGINGELGVDHHGFDLRARMTFSSRTLGEVEMAFEHNFDNADRNISTTYPSGQTVERTYDDASRLTSITDIVHTITYEARSLMDSMGCADGSATTITYDDIMRPEQRITGGSAGMLQGFGYQRDRTGNILSIEDMAEAAPGRPAFGAEHQYDAWYRVTSSRFDKEGASDETIDFGLDNIDNLTAITSSLGASSAAHVGALSYDSFAPNAVTEAAGMIIDYDDAGNVIERGPQGYTWDFMGRMTQATLEGSPIASFVYGSNQSRVARHELDSTTLYAFGDFELRDGISTLYIRQDNKRVARIESDELATTLFEDGNEDGHIGAADAKLSHDTGGESGPALWSSVRRLLMETGPDEGITFLHRDHLGNITLATGQIDGEQAVLGHRNFSPLGTERGDGSGYVDEYGFTGQEIDRSTGLIHFDWRYYDPRLGRWLSIDPAFGTTTGENISKHGEATTGYAYVAGNFVNTHDPTGLGLKNLVKKLFGKKGKGKREMRSKIAQKERGAKSTKMDKVGVNSSTGLMETYDQSMTDMMSTSSDTNSKQKKETTIAPLKESGTMDPMKLQAQIWGTDLKTAKLISSLMESDTISVKQSVKVVGSSSKPLSSSTGEFKPPSPPRPRLNSVGPGFDSSVVGVGPFSQMWQGL